MLLVSSRRPSAELGQTSGDKRRKSAHAKAACEPDAARGPRRSAAMRAALSTPVSQAVNWIDCALKFGRSVACN
jgi:hypothetical protein